MIKRYLWLALLAAVPSILDGCDNYALLDHFSLNGGLQLIPQTSELKPGDLSQLYAGGGEEPYSLYIANAGLYDDGTAFDLGLLDDTGPEYSYTAGNSIGSVRIYLRDSLGFSTSTLINVSPHPPMSVVADGTYGLPNEIKISWTYPHADKIEGIRILRSKDGAAFAPLAAAESLSTIQTSFVDVSASPGGMNIYRVFAYAGPSLSAYGEDGSVGNPP